MKKKSSNREKHSLEVDYKKIVMDFNPVKLYNSGITTPTQFTNPNDLFVKFSLYNETPNSITSTNTLLTSSI